MDCKKRKKDCTERAYGIKGEGTSPAKEMTGVLRHRFCTILLAESQQKAGLLSVATSGFVLSMR